MGTLIKLKCENCGAPLDVDIDGCQAYCQYCGHKLLFDINAIKTIYTQKEKTRRAVEQTKQAKERTTQTIEQTAQTKEKTAQAREETLQAKERTAQMKEKSNNTETIISGLVVLGSLAFLLIMILILNFC